MQQIIWAKFLRNMNVIKYSAMAFFLAAASLSISSCSKSSNNGNNEQDGNWVKRGEFDGNVRSRAVSFVIGDTAYVGTGYDGTERLQDFWKTNLTGNNLTWTQVANFPGTARNSAVGFNIDNMGYIGTGDDGVGNYYNDFYQYNPVLDTFIKKASFPGTARRDAVGFGLNSKGYITTGYDNNYLKDMYAYDPSTDSWSPQASYGGSKRSGGLAIVYNNKAYLVTGYNNGQPVDDFWSFDGTNWTQLRDIANTSTDSYDDDYTDIHRQYAAAFINKDADGKDYAFLTSGILGGITSKTWRYDFANDVWLRRTPLERTARYGAVAFTIQGRSFLGCGQSNTLYLDDFQEFLVTQAYNQND
jgi:N-acetylneuraminic acid mutarotase